MIGTVWPEVGCCLGLQREDHRKELFVVNRDDAVLVGVVLTERRRQRVEKNAALDEIVKENCSASNAVKFPDEKFDEPIGETVTEGGERGFQLVLVDAA
jgi:hypothetical protein